jgi:hypothetical protein
VKRLTLAFLLVLTLATSITAMAYKDPGDPGLPPDAASHK